MQTSLMRKSIFRGLALLLALCLLFTLLPKPTAADEGGLQGESEVTETLEASLYDLVQNLKNGDTSAIAGILQYQNQDGGWSFYGDGTDVDTTAAVLQALAPYYYWDSVYDACERALAVLSNLQKSNGGFSDGSVINVVSSSQVLLALIDLGIDPEKDGRFIKNGNTVIDAILDFYIIDGFEYTKGSGYDNMASMEAFHALNAYIRFLGEDCTPYEKWHLRGNTDQEEQQEQKEKEEETPKEQEKTEDPENEQSVEEQQDETQPAEAEKASAEMKQETDQDVLTSEAASGETIAAATGTTKSLSLTAGETKDAQALNETMEGVMSQAISFPDNYDHLTPDQEAQIIALYKQFDALDAEEKLYIGKQKSFSEFEAVLKKLGRKYHYDKETGVDFRDNAGGVLPWYVKITAVPKKMTDAELDQIKNVLGEKTDILNMVDISLKNVLSNQEWLPENLLKVKIPEGKTGTYENIAVIHFGKNGKMDVMSGNRVQDGVQFETQTFSTYALAAYEGNIYDELNGSQGSSLVLPLAILGVCMVAALAVVIILKRRNEEA